MTDDDKEQDAAEQDAAEQDAAERSDAEQDAAEQDAAEAAEEGFDADGFGEDDEELRDLLKGALAKDEEPNPRSDVLRGVQKRLRERSGGKFYADGWSTAKHPPTMTYLWTSVIMLAIALVAYAMLGSLVGEAVEVHNEPAPVRILHPRSIPSP